MTMNPTRQQMPVQQAVQILEQLGVTDETLPDVVAAVQALIAAGVVEGAPPKNALMDPRGRGGLQPAMPRPGPPEAFGAFEADNPANVKNWHR